MVVGLLLVGGTTVCALSHNNSVQIVVTLLVSVLKLAETERDQNTGCSKLIFQYLPWLFQLFPRNYYGLGTLDYYGKCWGVALF